MTIEGLLNRFIKYTVLFRQGFACWSWKNQGNGQRQYDNNDMCECRVDQCGACSLIANANSLLCMQCGKLIYGICARVNRGTTNY